MLTQEQINQARGMKVAISHLPGLYSAYDFACDNQDSDELAFQWDRLMAGQVITIGGGAAPACHIQVVSRI